jgi:hypothetical protein
MQFSQRTFFEKHGGEQSFFYRFLPILELYIGWDCNYGQEEIYVYNIIELIPLVFTLILQVITCTVFHMKYDINFKRHIELICAWFSSAYFVPS